MEKENLTHEQRLKVYQAIGSRMAPDDRLPSDVIAEDYSGNEDHYLRVMASYHNVKLD